MVGDIASNDFNTLKICIGLITRLQEVAQAGEKAKPPPKKGILSCD